MYAFRGNKIRNAVKAANVNNIEWYGTTWNGKEIEREREREN